MQLTFLFTSGTVLAQAIQSILAGDEDSVIDIHIERGIVKVASRPSFYSPSKAQEKVETQGASEMAQERDKDEWDIVSGCVCAYCEKGRAWRGF